MSFGGLHNSFFYYFFVFLEPGLTFVASAYALLLDDLYLENAVPLRLASRPPKNLHISCRNTLHLLGNCYGLLGLMSFLFLPYLNRSTVSLPVKVDLLRRFFVVLAIADITHIGISLADLGAVRWRIADWNTTAFGNIGITIGLFITRLAWYRATSDIRSSPKSAAAKEL